MSTSSRIAALERENAALRTRLDDLERRLAVLEQRITIPTWAWDGGFPRFIVTPFITPTLPAPVQEPERPDKRFRPMADG